MNIVIAHFGTHYVGMPGGVEKLTCYLSSYLVKQGHAVTVLYRDSTEGLPLFPIDSRVRQYNILFDKGEKIINEKLPFYLRFYREAVRLCSQSAAQGINAKYKGAEYGPRIREFLDRLQPDVVISCSAPSTKYVITDAGCKIPVITLFRGDPMVQMPLLSKEERIAVAQSAAIQVLWPSKVAVAQQYFPHVPVVAIGNAVFPAESMANPGAEKVHHLISCVGNVSGRKNQKLLWKAFSLLAAKYPDWRVEFWGEKTSHYARSLGEEIHRAGMGDRVMLKGKTSHIGDVYGQSDIFCIPSTSEGFPQGLAEAMSAGLPAIGLKSCGGTNELIHDGETGFLVDDEAVDFASALEKLINNRELRRIMGEKAHVAVAEYEPEKMWKIWENLLISVAHE